MYTKTIEELSKKIIVSVVFALLLTFAVQIYIQNNEKNKKLNIIYLSDLRTINALIEEEKNRLLSFAIGLSADVNLQKYLKIKNKNGLFNYLNRNWSYFKEYLNISEIHVVDKSGNSVVNFVNYDFGEEKENKRYNVLSFRKDINKALNEKQPVKTVFICRYFVGVRAIVPVKDADGNIIGAISVGESLRKIVPNIKKFLRKYSFILIKKDALKRCLKSETYKLVESKSENLNKFILLGNVEPVFLNALLSLEKVDTRFIKKIDGINYLFSLYSIQDFKNKEIGKFVVISDVNDIVYDFYVIIFASVLVYIILLIFIVLFINQKKKSFELKFNEIGSILSRLTERDFSVIKKYEKEVENKAFHSKVFDDLDIIKLNLIKLGIELKEHFEKMSNKVKKYAKDAFVDPLTGALNRRALIRIGENTVENVKIKNMPLSIILIDLDFFKNINDTYGHDTGDIVLKDFANTVKNIISKRDIVIRLGGEEFLIILPGADIDKAVEIAEKIRKTVESKSLKINGNEIKYTISAGVEKLTDEDSNIFDLIVKADKKLYEAKRMGRNKVVW